MINNFNCILTEEEEEEIYKQIKSYNESQNMLKNLIQKNIPKELELYLINDKWLEKWKKFSCYDYIKFNLDIKNKNRWREIRKMENASQYNIDQVNNKDLILFENYSSNTIITINKDSNFHLVTKECFDILTKNKIDKNEIFKIKFISYNHKIIAFYMDKILVLYINKNNFNFLLFILDNPNIQFFYMDIKESNMNQYLQKMKIDDNTENKQIHFIKEGYEYYINFINKSYNNIKNKRQKFNFLISSLINFEFHLKTLLEINKEENCDIFLINKDWLNNFKSKINYINILNQNKVDLDQIDYNMNDSNNELNNKINENNIIYYLKDNHSGNIYKYYSNYSLIDKDIWYNLIKFFYWDIEIQTKTFFLKNNNIIIQYDENNFEIVEISNYNIYQQLLFCIYDNYNTSKIINEIQNIGIDGYYQKYNINILYTKQSSQDLIDYSNNNQYLGKIINLNEAKNNFNDFTLLIYEQLDTNIKDNLKIGLNKIQINNNFNNINININNNANFNKKITNENIMQPEEMENNDEDELNPETYTILKRAFAVKKYNKNNNFHEKNNNFNNNMPINNKIIDNNIIGNNIIDNNNNFNLKNQNVDNNMKQFNFINNNQNNIINKNDSISDNNNLNNNINLINDNKKISFNMNNDINNNMNNNMNNDLNNNMNNDMNNNMNNDMNNNMNNDMKNNMKNNMNNSMNNNMNNNMNSNMNKNMNNNKINLNNNMNNLNNNIDNNMNNNQNINNNNNQIMNNNVKISNFNMNNNQNKNNINNMNNNFISNLNLNMNNMDNNMNINNNQNYILNMNNNLNINNLNNNMNSNINMNDNLNNNMNSNININQNVDNNMNNFMNNISNNNNNNNNNNRNQNIKNFNLEKSSNPMNLIINKMGQMNLNNNIINIVNENNNEKMNNNIDNNMSINNINNFNLKGMNNMIMNNNINKNMNNFNNMNMIKNINPNNAKIGFMNNNMNNIMNNNQFMNMNNMNNINNISKMPFIDNINKIKNEEMNDNQMNDCFNQNINNNNNMNNNNNFIQNNNNINNNIMNNNNVNMSNNINNINNNNIINNMNMINKNNNMVDNSNNMINNMNSINSNNINMNNMNFINNMNMNNMNNIHNNININLNNQNNMLQINNNQNQNNFIQNMNMNNMNNNIINQQVKQNINIKSIKAVIQCLSNFQEITQFLLNSSQYFITFHTNFPIIASYAKIIDSFQKQINNNEYIDNLKDIIDKSNNLYSSNPKDIFIFMIERIHGELKVPFEPKNIFNKNIIGNKVLLYNNFINNIFIPENTSIISKNCFGIREMKVQCNFCKFINYEYDIIKYIEFSIEEIYSKQVEKAKNFLNYNQNKDFNNLMNELNQKKININDLFDYYINFFQQNNKYSCHNCNKNTNCIFCYRFIILPNILCIILKRESKINIKVDFEEDFDISKFLSSQFNVAKKQYELIGIISYLEENDTYLTMLKNNNDSQWYKYKDDNVSKISFIEASHNNGTPYMLFYQNK